MANAITGGSLGELFVSIGTDLTNFNKGLNEAQVKLSKATRDFGDATSRLGTSITKMGLIVAAGFGVAAKSQGDFSQGIANVMTLVEDLDGTIRKKFSQGVDQLARAYGQTTDQLSKSLFDIQSATGDASTAVDKLTEASRLAVAGNSSLTESTSGLLTLMETYGDQLKDTADGADLLFKAQEKARATVGELASASGNFLPIAKQLNVNVNELYAAYAQVTVALGNASEAGTSLQGVLNGFLKPTEELTKLVKSWGYETAQQALESEGLIGVLERLSKVENDEIGKLFPRIEGLRSLGALTGNLSKVKENLIDITNREGAVDRALALQKEELNNKVARMRETMFSLFRLIGESLIPRLTELSDKILRVMTAIIDWGKSNKELLTNLVVVTAKVTAFSLAVGASLLVIGKLITAFGFLISPVGVVISIIAALTTAWVTNFGHIRDLTITIVNKIVNLLQDLRLQVAKTVFVFQYFAEMDLQDKLLHPIESIQQAMRVADALAEQFTNRSEGLDNFGEKFKTVVEESGQKTDEWAAKMADAKMAFDMLMQTVNDAVTQPETGKGTEDKGAEKKPMTVEELVKQNIKARAEDAKDLANNNKNTLKETQKQFSLLETMRTTFLGKKDEAEKKSYDLEKNLIQQTHDKLLWVLQQQSQHSKAAAVALQVIQIAKAIMNTAVGVTDALSTGNIPLAILIGTMGAAEVATIAGVKFQEGSDNVPFHGITDPGEIVIPRTFAQAIREGRLSLSGPGNNSFSPGSGSGIINNYFNFDNVNIASEFDLNDLSSRLGQEVVEKQRSQI